MHKPLNTKINIKYYRLLETLHRKSDIPKARLIEKSLELLAKQLERRTKADALLEAIEEAEEDFRQGRTKPLEAVVSEIEEKLASKKKTSR